MGIFLWIFLIPLVGIISPIWLSFELDIKSNDKAYLFLILPIIEIGLSILALVESIQKKTYLIDTWQLQLIILLMICGLSLTLIVILVEGINSSIKLSIKLTALSILNFIIVWNFLHI